MRGTRRARLHRRILAGAVAAGLLAMAGAARAQDPGDSAPASDAPTPSGWRDGAQVYASVCGHCHDAGVSPVILGRKLPAPLVTFFVRNGSRAMPAFRAAEIDDEALARLARYIAEN